VNLYDPHGPVSPKTKVPGPGQYNTLDRDTIKERTSAGEGYLNSVQLTSAFIEENTDRFGNQIYPTKEIVEKPGPANYYTDVAVVKNHPARVAPTQAKRKIFDPNTLETSKHVGPGSYNSNVETKKISFFLNQGDKWI